MRLDLESKILLLTNPKTDSTSIRDVLDNNHTYMCCENNIYLNNLKEQGLCSEYYHEHHTNASSMKSVLFNVYNLNIDDFFTFTFIRNPWDRVVSAYSYQNRDKNGFEFYDCNHDKNIAGSFSFKEFIEKITTEKIWNCVGIPSLENFCFDDNKQCIVKNIYKIEDFKLCNLEADLSVFLNRPFKFNNIIELPNLNQSNRKKNYREYYTEDWMIEKVRKIYNSDIEFGNYEF